VLSPFPSFSPRIIIDNDSAFYVLPSEDALATRVFQKARALGCFLTFPATLFSPPTQRLNRDSVPREAPFPFLLRIALAICLASPFPMIVSAHRVFCKVARQRLFFPFLFVKSSPSPPKSQAEKTNRNFFPFEIRETARRGSIISLTSIHRDDSTIPTRCSPNDTRSQPLLSTLLPRQNNLPPREICLGAQTSSHTRFYRL